MNQTEDQYEPGVYAIRIRGHLAARWADWFEGLTITHEANGDTLLTGPVIDQTALHGMLRKVRDLNMTLVAVNRIEPGQADASRQSQYTPHKGGVSTPRAGRADASESEQ
jgi:hypothetical protein